MAAEPQTAGAGSAAEAAAVHGDAAHAAAEAGAHGGGSAFPPFELSLFASQLFWFAVTFVVLYVILSRVVLPRIGSVQARRAATVKGDLDAAAIQGAAADDARAAMERATAKARADARAMIEKARLDMQAKLTAEQEAAEKRLADKIEAAEAKVNAARQQALAEVPKIAETLGRDIADKLAGARA